MPQAATYEKFYDPNYTGPGKEAAELLRELDEWRFVPKNIQATGNVATILRDAHNAANAYITSLSSPQTLVGGQSSPHWRNQLTSHIAGLRPLKWLALIYQHENELPSAKELADTMLSINACMSGIKGDIASSGKELTDQVEKHVKALAELISSSKTTLDGMAGNVKAQWEATLKEAEAHKRALEELAKKGQEAFQKQAMTAFGDAFHRENEGAEKKAWWAAAWGTLAAAAAVGLAVYLTIRPQDDATTTTDAAQLWRILPSRIAIFAFLAWMIGHFYSERKSFLHVAVANRHRRNLCYAYINGTKELNDTERRDYFLHIMPQISVLGKTGFITKETLPDMPGMPLLKAAIETTTAKAEKKTP